MTAYEAIIDIVHYVKADRNFIEIKTKNEITKSDSSCLAKGYILAAH